MRQFLTSVVNRARKKGRFPWESPLLFCSWAGLPACLTLHKAVLSLPILCDFFPSFQQLNCQMNCLLGGAGAAWYAFSSLVTCSPASVGIMPRCHLQYLP